MTKSRLALVSAIALFAVGGAAYAKKAPAVVHEAQSNEISVTELKFFASGVKAEAGELEAAPAFGDLGHDKHGTFIRMPAGFVSSLHTHTQDYYGVVINGVAANIRPGQPDKPLAPGSYWFQRGEEAHITKCLSKVDCLFFITQPGAFDYVPAKE